MSTAVPIYRAIMIECERRRLSLGWSMERLSEVAGISDRMYAKALYPEGAAGRQLKWDTLQPLIETLFPDGFDLAIRAKTGPALDAMVARYRIKTAAANVNPRTQRELMRELGKKGGQRSAESRAQTAVEKASRRARAKHAASIRWRTPKLVEITGRSGISGETGKRA